LFIFLFINFIFSVKYLSRVTSFYLIISLLITSIYFLIWKYRIKITDKIKIGNRLNYLVLILFIILSTIALKIIPADKLNVDRWSVITSFWDNYFNNKYVYFAKSNLGNPPGPMPFYFLLALPFYLIGELGYFSILGLIVFFFLIKKANISKNLQFIIILLVTTSTFFLWEVICRSNIFLNGVIVLLVINTFFKSNLLILKT